MCESLGEGVVMKVEIKIQSSMGVRYPHGEGNQSRLLKKIVPFDKNYHACKNPIIDTRKETERLFAALSEGGKISMPLAVAFWGDYFGSLTDKFGVNWMVNCAEK